jgi:hypothetical protein
MAQKIVKASGVEPSEFEKQVAQELVNLEVNFKLFLLFYLYFLILFIILLFFVRSCLQAK